LIELLVVIAIIAILAALLLPALSKAKQSALRAQCVSNLHQWAVAYAMYANDFGNSFPDNTQPPASDTAWMSALFNDYFYPLYLYKSNPGDTTSGTRNQNDVLYCPVDGWHRAYEAAQNATNLIGYSTLPFRTLNPLDSHYNAYGLGQWFTRTKFGTRYRNAPVMTDDIELLNGHWITDIPGIPPMPSSAHAGPGSVPLGGNFLYEDGHVEWIKFVIGPLNSFPIIAPAASGKSGGNTYFIYPIQYGKGPW
jgi:type II secretory pathway pseudopilin PulG